MFPALGWSSLVSRQQEAGGEFDARGWWGLCGERGVVAGGEDREGQTGG